MAGMQFKYFVLKPKGTDIYAQASRKAMRVYANMIYKHNEELSNDLKLWADSEFSIAIMNGMHEEEESK